MSANLALTGEFVTKLIFIFVALGYFIFSIVIANQIRLMSDTLVTKTSPILKFVALLHALLVLVVLIIIFKLLIL